MVVRIPHVYMCMHIVCGGGGEEIYMPAINLYGATAVLWNLAKC